MIPMKNKSPPWRKWKFEEKALIYDDASDKISVSQDDGAKRDFYARAFQEWSLGNVEGTAEEIFDGVTMLLESD